MPSTLEGAWRYPDSERRAVGSGERALGRSTGFNVAVRMNQLSANHERAMSMSVPHPHNMHPAALSRAAAPSQSLEPPASAGGP